MKQTPMHNGYNSALLQLVPIDVKRVIEVGCSSGTFARAYRRINPECEYVGMEIDAGYAEVARQYCSSILIGDIEQMLDSIISTEPPYDCWIFGDVLEHLYDPWQVLKAVAGVLPANGYVLACIPNMQHWTLQIQLNRGDLRYQDAGLLDRTHIRWFTRTTIVELFSASGLEIVELGGRVFDEPQRDLILPLLRSLANASGADPEQAALDATPLQWIVKAVPLITRPASPS